MAKRPDWKKLIISILIPLAVGGAAALIANGSFKDFEALNKPPLAPPAWAFPAAWTLLYILMGIASYLVCTADAPSGKKRSALVVYAVSLVFNFLWSIIFFNLDNYLLAFIWLCALWLLIVIATVQFFGIRRTAGRLMLPYILWVSFAGYLNYGIYLLN